MQPEQAFSVSEAALEYLQHASSYLAAGAVGFRWAVVRGRDADLGLDDAEQLAYRDALAIAARVGLAGALFVLLRVLMRLPMLADRRQMAVAEFVLGDLPTALRLVLLLVGIAGLALAASRRPFGWRLAPLAPLSGLAGIVGIFGGEIPGLANPIHVLVGGLWLGTLLVIVLCGIPAALRLPDGERRGTMVAEMVNGFSPLALGAGGALVVSGVWTAWRHLGSLDALGTTDYGRTLLVKLAVVALVIGLGAFNWRRQRPTLGDERTALRVRRTATMELAAAAVVLLVTVYLLQQPAPAEARRAPQPAPTVSPQG